MKKIRFLLPAFSLFAPFIAFAGYEIELQEAIGQTTSVKGDTGMELLVNYIQMIYTYGASILGIICVLVIVVSGIQIIMGGAQADFVTQAKTRIMQALLSLAILFLSAVILKTINPGFFCLTDCPTPASIEAPANPGEDDNDWHAPLSGGPEYTPPGGGSASSTEGGVTPESAWAPGVQEPTPATPTPKKESFWDSMSSPVEYR